MGGCLIPPFKHTPDEDRQLKRVQELFDLADKGVHKDFRAKAERFHGLYRGYQRDANAWATASPRDRDEMIDPLRRSWGAELHIPYCFSTIETIVPRAVSQRPRMLFLPRDTSAEDNVETVRLMIDSQQDRIDYDLTLQDVLKSGMIYGLGVSKTWWRHEYANRKTVTRATFPRKLIGAEQYVLKGERVCTFDDPDVEWVDPFNFFWDPYGHDMRTVEWVIQRSWQSTRWVMDRLTKYGERPADWATSAAAALKLSDVEGMQGSQVYDEIHNERNLAAGGTGDTKANKLHEVWEFHDGERILTVLDRQVLVQDAESPTLGHIPFSVYRPTKVPGEMVGIGEIEPIQHLQAELNTLRSQRRDNATLKLMQTYAFNEAAIDPDDIEFGPGRLIPVNGDPRESLFPINVGDIPNSGYQEEASIVGDIQRTTGVDDTVSGADGAPGGATSTATGVQLVQAAANKRIENKARRLEIEVIRRDGRTFLMLNQRMILESRDVRIDAPVEDESDPNAKRWQWFQVAPESLRGEFDIIPEGGSTQPENTPQLRQDAQMKWQMFNGNPMVNQTALLKSVLKGMGFDHPDTVIQQGETLSPGVLERLQRMGVNPEWIQIAVQQEQAQDPTEGQAQPQMDEAA